MKCLWRMGWFNIILSLQLHHGSTVSFSFVISPWPSYLPPISSSYPVLPNETRCWYSLPRFLIWRLWPWPSRNPGTWCNTADEPSLGSCDTRATKKTRKHVCRKLSAANLTPHLSTALEINSELNGPWTGFPGLDYLIQNGFERMFWH